MGKRKQPFGYKMEFGDIVPEPEEAEAVRSIYLRYIAGASFKTLAEALQEQGLPYDGDKPWNKNMVARILEDQRYTGTDRFPSLITEEQFLAAQERRKQMTPERTQTPAQKELRKLCGGAPPQYVERQVLGILNRLVHDPQLITASISDVADSPIFQRQRRELDDLLRSPPVDEEQAKSSALALASFMLTSIGPEEYETCRLQRLFQCRQPMRELDAELLRQSVRKITYGDRIVKILLKNNQWMEGGTHPALGADRIDHLKIRPQRKERQLLAVFSFAAFEKTRCVAQERSGDEHLNAKIIPYYIKLWTS